MAKMIEKKKIVTLAVLFSMCFACVFGSMGVTVNAASGTQIVFERFSSSVTSDNAVLNIKARNPKGAKVKYIGTKATVYDAATNKAVAAVTESYSITSPYLIIKYDIRKEMKKPGGGKVTLAENHSYYVRYQVRQNGYGWSAASGKYAFKTAKKQASRDKALAWVKKQNGKAIDFDGIYGVQCVDLIQAYYNYFG